MQRLERNMDKTWSRFLTGESKRDEYSYSSLFRSLFNEADQVRSDENATSAAMYGALENYNECVRIRTRNGPVKGPDETMTRALTGIYDLSLKLKQFDKLADLEKKIVSYCPEKSDHSRTAYQSFRHAATIYKNRKKDQEAIRCLESAIEVWNKLHKKDRLPNVNEEFRIATIYLALGDSKNAKLRLERTWTHLEKWPVNHRLRIPTLIRLGDVYQSLKNYRTSSQKFHAAELLSLKKYDANASLYLSQIYYKWAISLQYEGKLKEAESKLINALRVLKDDKSKIAVQKFLDNIRKEQNQVPKFLPLADNHKQNGAQQFTNVQY